MRGSSAFTAEFFPACRTSNCNFAMPCRHPDDPMALRTYKVVMLMILFVGLMGLMDMTAPALELQILLILHRALDQILRQDPIEYIDKQSITQDHADRTVQDHTDDIQGQSQDQKELVVCIDTIASIHEFLH